MRNKKKGIYLEDYSGEFNFKQNLSNLNVSFNRVAFIFFIFFTFFILFSSKLIYLGQLEPIFNNTPPNLEFRSTILDRNGNILAKTVITKNIGINPKEVIDKNKLLLKLKIIFPDKNFDEIKKKLDSDKFFYLEKKISNEKFNQIILLGEKSIKQEPKITRVYPQKNLFSHVIGQIDDDNNGISGVESFFDYELKSKKNPLILTVDTSLQHLIRNELILAKEIFNNKGSAAILMDINNGEILSMVSLPDYNLNKREKIVDENYINRATKAIYEMGSVFKTFTLAAGLNEGVIEVDTKFENLERKIKCGGNTISEYDDEIPKDLTAEEILIRSGNIGSVRIGQKLGIEKYRSFLTKIGIIDKIEFDIEEIGQPLPITWGKCKLVTSSFGHGITTTALQLSKAYAIISNGGYLISPTLIKFDEINNIKFKKILKDGVSEKVNKVLRKIVSSKDGTANFANITGYNVGGKTGTAQKSIYGKYSKKKVNTFVSIFPYDSPRYVLLVLLDEPEANKDYIYNYRDGSNFKYKGNWRNTSGWTTVEIAGKIIEKIGPILATKY